MNNNINWNHYEENPVSHTPIGENMDYVRFHNQNNLPDDPDRRWWLTRRLESPEAMKLWRNRRYTIISIFSVILFMLLLINIGLGYTILTIFFLIAAYIIGGWFDGNPKVYHLLNRFL